jgi:mono/diheme cytochrome c family protein
MGHLDAQSLLAPLTFTDAQAEQGAAAYAEQCASCHGPNLDDGAFGPPLTGVAFRQRWGGQSADNLLGLTTSTMPPGQPNSLGDTVYTELLAFIIRENGAKPGLQPLPSDA